VNILLTGASSFTGHWFARELRAAGHSLVAPLRGAADDYAGVRGERVKRLAQVADIVWSAPFGSDAFMAAATSGSVDLLCLHHARVADYRSPDFDVALALAENTKRLPHTLRTLAKGGLKGVVLTGSVFEANEGRGTEPLRAFSPYGVSKNVTAEVVRYWCSELKVPLGKFVIPNPFGPYEEPRFCAYLIKTWKAGQIAVVKTPDYLRDNIHVDLMAKDYVRFAEATTNGPGFAKRSPSGYAETQGAFTKRYAAAMAPRLKLKADVQLPPQTDFSEPMARVNTDPVQIPGWSENAAWDAIAEYYR
jgi:UDP-glucose 4-epimerase